MSCFYGSQSEIITDCLSPFNKFIILLKKRFDKIIPTFPVVWLLKFGFDLLSPGATQSFVKFVQKKCIQQTNRHNWMHVLNGVVQSTQQTNCVSPAQNVQYPSKYCLFTFTVDCLCFRLRFGSFRRTMSLSSSFVVVLLGCRCCCGVRFHKNICGQDDSGDDDDGRRKR